MSDQFRFDFDITPVAIPVVIRTDGKGVYEGVLGEPSENAARKWRNGLAASQRYHGDEQAMTIDGIADTSSQLVADCLFPRVKVEVVRTWPSRVVKQLFEKAKELGDLYEAPDSKESLDKAIAVLRKRRARLDDPKGANGQGPTTTSSDAASGSDAPSTSTSASAGQSLTGNT